MNIAISSNVDELISNYCMRWWEIILQISWYAWILLYIPSWRDCQLLWLLKMPLFVTFLLDLFTVFYVNS